MRKDSWSPNDDLLLAEIVLKHIREGGTRLVAFEDVAEKLERTADACAFRWNTVLKEKYETAIDIAKKASRLSKTEVPQAEKATNKKEEKLKMKKEKKTEVIEKQKKRSKTATSNQKTEAKQSKTSNTSKKKLSEESLEQSLRVLQDHLKAYLTIKKDFDQANEKVSRLEKENQQLKEKIETLEKDYAQVIAIINKAQQMIS